MSITHIVCPVDGSDGSRTALELALEIAQRHDAEVTVLQVIEEAGPLPTYDQRPPEGLDRVQWLADRRFEPLQPPLEQTAVRWRRRIEEGYAAEEICRVAADERADMIVIGSRGLSPAGRLVLGSVSDRVVHHAPCHVAVARES